MATVTTESSRTMSTTVPKMTLTAAPEDCALVLHASAKARKPYPAGLSPLEHLPLDLHSSIFLLLDTPSLHTLLSVSRTLRQSLLTNPYLRRRLLRPVPPPPLPELYSLHPLLAQLHISGAGIETFGNKTDHSIFSQPARIFAHAATFPAVQELRLRIAKSHDPLIVRRADGTGGPVRVLDVLARLRRWLAQPSGLTYGEFFGMPTCSRMERSGLWEKGRSQKPMRQQDTLGAIRVFVRWEKPRFKAQDRKIMVLEAFRFIDLDGVRNNDPEPLLISMWGVRSSRNLGILFPMLCAAGESVEMVMKQCDYVTTRVRHGSVLEGLHVNAPEGSLVQLPRRVVRELLLQGRPKVSLPGLEGLVDVGL